MDIRLNEDQLEIARQARRFFENETPMQYVRAMFEDERGFTGEIWGKMVEMGWTAMRVPEEYGGLGMELIDLAVVMEEMGRAVVPGPFFSSTLLAAEILMEAGNDPQKAEYLPRLASGEIRGALAVHEPEAGGDLAYVHLPARTEGDGFVLSGAKTMVLEANTADFLIVAGRTRPSDGSHQGVTLFLMDTGADGVTVSQLPALDATRKPCLVEFNQVRLGPDSILGQVHQGWAPLMCALQRAQVGLAAECVGGAQRALEIATKYAKERVQFDQPLGAYQTIKHTCAQMFVEVESSRSLVYWAAWAQDADPREAALSAAVAKTYAGDAFRNAATKAIQVLGGTGFTWEHDIHFYLKRAKADEMLLGDPYYQRERLVQLLTS